MPRKGQPINADVPLEATNDPPSPSPEPPAPPPAASARPSTPAPPEGEAPPDAAAPRESKPKRRRRPIPAALKAIAGLVFVAVVFIAAAILGGGSEKESSIPGAAPSPDPPTATTEAAETEAPAELGYPEFATNNTTRVGGPDPASNAAGVALAVYPSPEEALRPAAVTLVDAADWQTAVAAAVLMAEPLRAPPLVSEADGLPDATEAALDALGPTGKGVSGAIQAFAIGAAAVPSTLKATRAKGTGAAGAAAIARLRERLFGRRPRSVLVAPADEPAFALPAAAWAARSGDPVLFAGENELPAPTAAALRRYREARVYLLGPSSAISSRVVREISSLGPRVRRVSGEDPVTNSIALARYADGAFGWNVNDPGHGFVVARADSPLDAVAAAPLSASGTWGPLLLTDSADTLPTPLRDYLLDVKPGYTTDPTRAFYNHVWIIGDQDAIDVAQQAEIDELAELAKIGGEP
jgi:hypothetical protein